MLENKGQVACGNCGGDKQSPAQIKPENGQYNWQKVEFLVEYMKIISPLIRTVVQKCDSYYKQNQQRSLLCRSKIIFHQVVPG